MNLHVSGSKARSCGRVLLLGAALTLGACAGPGATKPAMVAGGVLTSPAGMTLYTFDRDTAGSGRSVCNGPCAANWPALTAPADAKDAGDWTVVTRDDGAKQWAYKGKPLYAFAKDAKPGDRTGDGFNQVWAVARP